MENSGARAVRRVICPRCHNVLEEPSAPVYQCGGCGTSLRAKIRNGNTGDVAGASPSRSGLPPQSRHLDSSDVASTSRSSTPTPPGARSCRRQATDTTSRRETGDPVSARRHGSGDVASTSSTPGATSSRQQDTDTTSRCESGDLMLARKHGSGDVASTSSTPGATRSSRQGTDTRSRLESSDAVLPRNRVSEQVALIENRGHDQSANRGVYGNSEARRPRETGDAERSSTSPGVSVHFPRGSENSTSELQNDTKKRSKGQAELPDAERMRHSGEAAGQLRSGDHEELAPQSAQTAAAHSGRDVLRREDDVAATAGGKAPSPSRQELQAENLGPLPKKILKTLDELKGDLSELFSKSPEVNPTARARPPRLPKQEGYVSRTAVASGFPARARHAAAAVDHRGSAVRVVKPGLVAPPRRGLPSRRYRQCRADPCCYNVQPRSSCHHCCCRHHGKPECSSCRGHCCRPRAQEQSAPRKPQAAKEAKRRQPPRNHCRPVLKGAPFIVCSSCFKLVQVPADFAVPTNTVRKLRCGSCSAVLSYSYRDPARKKPYQDSIDQFSTDGSELHGGKGYAQPHPFAPFGDGFGRSSCSTEDEQAPHVSRNTSFDTIEETKGMGRLHWLMGYGSASELLQRSPDLYESFSERTTPDVGQYDRKGKGVCIDNNDYDVDDSDEEDRGVLKRSAARGSGWPLAGILDKGVPGPGAFRIKS